MKAGNASHKVELGWPSVAEWDGQLPVAIVLHPNMFRSVVLRDDVEFINAKMPVAAVKRQHGFTERNFLNRRHLGFNEKPPTWPQMSPRVLKASDLSLLRR